MTSTAQTSPGDPQTSSPTSSRAQATTSTSVASAVPAGPPTDVINKSPAPSATSSTTAAATSSTSHVSSSVSENFSGLSSTKSAAPVANDTVGSHTPNTFSVGALAGGIVGGFSGAIILCIVAGALFLRFRRREPASLGHVPQNGEQGTDSRSSRISMLKGRASLLASFEATGWQKHLPGEKDDGTIKKKFTSILDLVRTHIDGFYGAGAESSKEVHLNESFSNDILEAIQRQGVSSLLLEAAMLRLIVHMISLRSDPRDSLLPADFTTIPAEQGWHMEIDGRHDRRDVESTKGWLQAFAQWRRLTTFLRNGSHTVNQYREEHEGKLDQTAHELSTLLSPWQTPGTDTNVIIDSLREILMHASDFGMMLFAQQSTFAFDWSRKSRRAHAVIIRPALVRRIDETGQVLSPAQVLRESEEHVAG